MDNKSYPKRFESYREIFLCTLVLFGLATGLGVLVALGWKQFTPEANLRWEIIALVAGTLGLLPYMVIVAKVWEVNISLFGGRVQTERPQSGDSKDRPGLRID